MKYSITLLIVIVVVNLAVAQHELKNWKIAYNVYYDTADGNYEIFVMNADGSDKKNISNSKGIDWVYYAYEDKIYFASDRDTTSRKYQLFEMDANGGHVRKISNLVIEDSYLGTRKKGGELIVKTRVDDKRMFTILDWQGKVLSTVVPPGLENFNDASFLPNGQLVFRGMIKNNFKIRSRNSVETNDELYVMNADGTGLRKLTTYPPNDTTVEWHSYHAGPPRWNDGEKFISYMSFQNGRYDLFGVKPDQPGSFKIINLDLEPGWHDWTSDGKWLVTDVANSTRYDIYLINWKTKEKKRLTSDWRAEQAPVFVKVKK